MKKKIGMFVICFLLAIGIFPTTAFAEQNTEDIIILYESDVHCEVEGYSKLAAMKKELQQTYAKVGVVSGGDYIQGNSLGVISQGEYIVELMNLVGYDAVTLGNHEFDYRLERLEELIGMMDTEPVCCNFQKVGENTSYFKPYSIVSYGDVDIAYIGITTPSTLTASSPTQFKDEDENFIYTFHSSDLYDVVQESIDAAEAEGADYIIAISHVGYADDEIYGTLEDVEDLIRNTDGFDVVLDAHAHVTVENKEITDKGGNTVVLSAAGTKFEYIGKLTISDDVIETELMKTEDYPETDPEVDAYIERLYAEYATLGERKVATSEVDLVIQDENGNRLVRTAETNLGDLCAEAFRSVVGADIGYINGGGLRSGISAGDVSFNQLLGVLPFNNTVVLAEVDGQTIKDMMEMAMMSWPEENGSFPHLAGITFSLNTSIPSSVVLDEAEEFDSVAGPYRVYDIKVFNREKGKYEPIDLEKKYTIASHNYALVDHGSGMKMLQNAEVLRNDGMLDVEALEQYIAEELDGVIGEEYTDVSVNITFTEGEVSTSGNTGLVLWIAGIAVGLILLLGVIWLVKRKKKL